METKDPEKLIKGRRCIRADPELSAKIKEARRSPTRTSGLNDVCIIRNVS
jgi:hypothetical protein